jgi:hypothetical protein
MAPPPPLPRAPVRRLFHALSSVFFGLALLALAWLLVPDLWVSFRPSPRHQQAGALALAFLGISFVCLQLGAGTPWKERIKGMLLGLAFVLWGGEQFMPPGAAVTAIDSAVITIFVVDLGLVIAGRLEAPPRG